MLRALKDVQKWVIGAADGDIGRVKDLYFDDHAWAIRYLVVETGNWWLGQQVLIAPQWISGVHRSDKTVAVDLSREAVKAAPPHDPSAPLYRRSETGLHTHHGRPPYWKTGSMRERAT